MACVMHLDGSLGEELADLKGLWYLETGYGRCAVALGEDVLFRSPDEAQAWMLERVTHA